VPVTLVTGATTSRVITLRRAQLQRDRPHVRLQPGRHLALQRCLHARLERGQRMMAEQADRPQVGAHRRLPSSNSCCSISFAVPITCDEAW
jgi:hypothetical protein